MPLVFRRNAFKVVTTALELRGGVLFKRSTVSFSFDRMPTPEEARQMQTQMRTFGGLIGFRIRRNQTIRSLTVAGAECRSDPKKTKQLQRAFGAGTGEKWVGFSIGANAALLGASFETEMRITFSPRSVGTFQLVPIVVAFGDQNLKQHMMLGLSLLKARPPFDDSTIELVAER